MRWSRQWLRPAGISISKAAACRSRDAVPRVRQVNPSTGAEPLIIAALPTQLVRAFSTLLQRAQLNVGESESPREREPEPFENLAAERGVCTH
jgi:hypothetical protein